MSEMVTLPREMVEYWLAMFERLDLAASAKQAREALAAGEARPVEPIINWAILSLLDILDHQPELSARLRTTMELMVSRLTKIAAPPQPAEPVITDSMVEVVLDRWYGGLNWRAYDPDGERSEMRAALVAAMGAKR